ncbi:MAG: carboxypeptidase-like regulatory domain-containing protein [Planctomycetota bacterium]|nr:carboxypeptidase-like regulatory domain-containing protein [Planctomycetota bacterium]
MKETRQAKALVKSGAGARLHQPASMEELIWMEIDRATAAVGTSIVGWINSADLAVTLGGATIRAVNTISNEVYSTSLNVDGSFVIPEVVAGEFRFSFDNGLLVSPDLVTARDGESGVVDFDAIAGGSITGTVTYSSTDTPIAGASVVAVPLVGDVGGATTVDTNGTYRIEWLVTRHPPLDARSR